MPDIHFSLSFHVIFLLLVALCSVAGAAFVYRVTLPPVSSIRRHILIFLRSIGLIFLFLLIGRPLLSLITHSDEQPIVAVLVDNSQSMTLNDHGKKRDESLKSVLRSAEWQQISKQGILSCFKFDQKVQKLTSLNEDSVTFGGETTDIAEALRAVKGMHVASNLQALVLITDGNSTVGMNPLYEAEELDTPVFTIGVGDTTEQKDLLIRRLLTNEITYIGTKLPVNVTVHSVGFGGEKVQVSLRSGTTILDEKLLILEKGTRDYDVPLLFSPEKEGMQKFTVEISELPGELTFRNNRINFFLKVLKSKFVVALIAGAPSQDVASIRRVLTKDKNIDVKSFVESKDGRFYEDPLTVQVLNEVDCMVLVDFPTGRSKPNDLQLLIDAANTGKPLLFVLSRTIDFSKFHMLDPVLPFSVGGIVGNEIQVFVSIPEAQRNNPILKIGSGINTPEMWSKLPPIFRKQGIFHSKIESEILATIRLQSVVLDEPFIVTRNVNKRKSLAVLGYGLWRWNMLSDAGSGTEGALENFISNAIRWLTTREDSRRIRVQASKQIYTAQEAVEFNAQVYDDTYKPLDDAQIEIHLKHRGEVTPLTLTSLGSGQYQGQYDRLDEGDYKFAATVKLNGKVIGGDQGTFLIGGLNAEYLETRMNKPLLLQIAAQTGGRYYDYNEIASLEQDMVALKNFKSREISRTVEIEIWSSRWVLPLILLIFSLEWFFRKRSGML